VVQEATVPVAALANHHLDEAVSEHTQNPSPVTIDGGGGGGGGGGRGGVQGGGCEGGGGGGGGVQGGVGGGGGEEEEEGGRDEAAPLFPGVLRGGGVGGVGDDEEQLGRRSPAPPPPAHRRDLLKHFASAENDPQEFTFITQPGGHCLARERSSREDIEHIEDEAGRVGVVSPGKYELNVFTRLPQGKTIWDIRFNTLPTIDGTKPRNLAYALTGENEYDGERMLEALPYPIQFPSEVFELYAVEFPNTAALVRPKFEVNNSVIFVSGENSLSIGTVTGVSAKFIRSRNREFEHYTYDTRSIDSGHEFKGLIEGNILRVFKGGERLLWRTPKGEAKLVLAKQPIPYRLHCDVLEEMTIVHGSLNMNWVAQDLDETDPLYTVYCLRVSISHFGLEVHDTFHLNHRTVYSVH